MERSFEGVLRPDARANSVSSPPFELVVPHKSVFSWKVLALCVSRGGISPRARGTFTTQKRGLRLARQRRNKTDSVPLTKLPVDTP